MIEIVVVDVSAEARSKLAERISQFQREASASQAVCPLINVKPLSIHELKFHSSPDIVIMGRDCLRQDLTEVALIKKHFLKAKIIADLGVELDCLLIAEQMARFGVDDVLHDRTTAMDFFRKLILLHRAKKEITSGTLILVDSGKGGMGVTSIAAGMAEACMSFGKKVIVVDLDTETQDLSRFLQAKPYSNENLDAILDQEHPVLTQTVEQCLYKIWEQETLTFVPPPNRSLYVNDARDSLVGIFLSFLESLDAISEIVIVDIAGLRGSLYHALLKVADKIVFVLQNDPASLFASVHTLKGILSVISSSKDLFLIENARASEGLPAGFISSELARKLNLPSPGLRLHSIVRCKHGARWPASGGTIYSQSTKSAQHSIVQLLDSMGLLTIPQKSPLTFQRIFSSMRLMKLPVSKDDKLKPLSPTASEKGETMLSLPDPATLVGKAIIV